MNIATKPIFWLFAYWIKKESTNKASVASCPESELLKTLWNTWLIDNQLTSNKAK